MKFIKTVNEHITQNRKDSGNGFYVLYGYIEQDKTGEFFYTEYARDNPRTIAINDMPGEVKKRIASILN